MCRAYELMSFSVRVRVCKRERERERERERKEERQTDRHKERERGNVEVKCLVTRGGGRVCDPNTLHATCFVVCSKQPVFRTGFQNWLFAD